MITTTNYLKEQIRTIPDFPKPGISFKDITPLLLNPVHFNSLLDDLEAYYKPMNITKVCGIEARGFIVGAALANRLNVGFIPIRKAGKLPYKTIREDYMLEYGTDSIEIHSDAIVEGDVVLIHDDLLATGGTMLAAAKLVSKFSPETIMVNTLIELSFLNGRNQLEEHINSLISLIQY